ncbi:hypothetical protein AJ85_06920 [Alkalihalobacillus alcalophilus ATCC 27647 = CGMCC 1.3604]|uniref:Uncharacterized protein n=1 Tax=Alkalihalobacillus alcalophilus ATCC 27647 = CGMCC 1.3604 TaxID=1218173 RepID=A0A4S4K4V6_ALKAL|nr:hypothetical protein AJ85_06920 [Alkalihalobacillus alcalophilus ATCC 27647 = CGMCC 1.3604]
MTKTAIDPEPEFLSVRVKNQSLRKHEKRVWIMTIVFTFILCVNILYWEFYY